MKRAAHKLLKLVSPSTAHTITEWHMTLSGHRYELLKRHFENALLSARSSSCSLEWTISRIRLGEKRDQRLAFISVLPPATTGIAACSLRSWLGGKEKVDLFCPVSDDDWFLSLADRFAEESGGACRLFDVKALLLALQHNNYRNIIIAAGNSHHNAYIFEALGKIRAAGWSRRVMMYLHDVCLLHLIHDAVGLAPAAFIDMLEKTYGRPMPSRAVTSDLWKMSDALVEEGVLGVRFFFEHFGVRRYLVNSATAAELCASDLGGLAARVEQIFHPVSLPRGWHPPAGEANALEQAKPLTIGTFGMPGPDKCTDLVVAAVRELRRRNVAVRLVMAGFECANWARRHADELKGLDVDARDAPSDHEFLDAMHAVDVAVQLRRRNLGESSGVVHELLALGRSVVVSDIGSFREFGEAVRTVDGNTSPIALANCILDTWRTPVPQAAIADYVASHSSEWFRQSMMQICKDGAWMETAGAGDAPAIAEASWHGTARHAEATLALRGSLRERPMQKSAPPGSMSTAAGPGE